MKSERESNWKGLLLTRLDDAVSAEMDEADPPTNPRVSREDLSESRRDDAQLRGAKAAALLGQAITNIRDAIDLLPELGADVILDTVFDAAAQV